MKKKIWLSVLIIIGLFIITGCGRKEEQTEKEMYPYCARYLRGAKERFGEYGGYAQQYLFYYARDEKIKNNNKNGKN